MFTMCPKSWIHSKATAEVTLYSDYRWWVDHGTLPVAGGKLDQSPLFVEAVAVIESVVAELQAREGQGVG